MSPLKILGLVALLAGCSQQRPLAVDRQIPVTARSAERPYAQLCLIGTIDCLDLDDRPFQFCQLGDQRCASEGHLELLAPPSTR